MDIESIARKNNVLQEHACRNIFDALDILQEYAERTSWYWAGQVGIDEPVKSMFDPYLRVSRGGRHHLKRLFEEGFASIDTWFAGSGSKFTHQATGNR